MQDLLKNKLVQHYAGSHAYGTNIATSDVDIRGIFIAPQEYIRTPFFNCKEVQDVSGEDTKFYELTNFFKLYCEMNPNILETLWVDKSDVITTSKTYEFLRSKRDELLTSKCAFTFTGYSYNQLSRMKNHSKWHNNPQPIEAPRQCDYISMIYNFTDDKILKFDPYDQNANHRFVHFGDNTFGVFSQTGSNLINQDYSLKTYKDDLNLVFNKKQNLIQQVYGFLTSNPNYGTRNMPKFIVKYNKDVYRDDYNKWLNYWTWKNNRNEARAELEKKFGLDVKHVMHLVRLLRMGEEILTEGVVKVRRPDAKELLEIRNGSWSYEKTIAYAEEKDDYIKNVLYKSTTLPHSLKPKIVSDILMEAQDIAWGEMK